MIAEIASLHTQPPAPKLPSRLPLFANLFCNAMAFPDMEALETHLPQRIGAGSFATIFVLRGQLFAFKVVQHTGRVQELQEEFDTLQRLHSTCNSESLFAIPRPIAYNDPIAETLLTTPAPTPATSRRRVLTTGINAGFFAPLKTDHAAYVMERVHVLPTTLGEIVRQCFYHKRHRESDAAAPYLCRLYFGRTLPPTGGLFINPINFPLDVSRYEILLSRTAGGTLLSVMDVADGLGEMLSRIHWIAGYDGRDIEFVMGGDGYGSVRYYVIDFNQVGRLILLQGMLLKAHVNGGR